VVDLRDLHIRLEALSAQLLDIILAMETYFCEIQKELIKIRAVLPNLHFSDGENKPNS
jgi:hypothetical protein